MLKICLLLINSSCLPKNQLLFFHQRLWRRTILPMLYQQLKALYWANLLMNLSTKPLYKIRSRDSWSFRITKVCYLLCQTPQQQQIKMKSSWTNAVKFIAYLKSYLIFCLSPLLMMTVKKTQQQMLLKNWNWLTSNFNDRLRIFTALRKKSGRKLTSFERRKLVWEFWHL